MALIVGLGEPAPEKEFPLSDSPVVLGRLSHCDVRVDHGNISRQHARIVPENGGYILEDLDSTNFVFLNQNAITRTPLKHGDVFNVGGAAEFIYLEHPDAERVDLARQRLAEDPEFSPAAYSMKKAVHVLADEIFANEVEKTAKYQLSPQPTTLPIAHHPLEVFETLLHVSYGLNSSTSLSRVLERLLDSLLTTIWADKGYVLLLSGKSRRLEVKVAKSRGGILENVGFEDFSFRLLERAVEEKESLFWPATDMEPPREVGSPTLESLLRNEDRDRTLLCLPLKLRNTTIGGAYLERGTQTQRFSRRERVLSEAICHQAAIAIDNARLYEKLRSKQKAVEAACTEAQDKNLRLGILNEKLDQKVAELSALNAVSRGMNMISTLDEVLKLIMEKSMELVGVEKGSIMLVNDETGFLEVKTLLGGSSLEPVTGATRLKIGDGIAGLALKQGVPVIITDGFKNKKFKRLMESDRSIRNLLCVPLILNSRKIGVINLTNKLNGPGFTENDKIVVTTMANQAAITIENARLYNMAVFDGLTNLHVPRYFHVCLQNELSRSRRYGTQLSLILADLDYFKKINDIHGHQVGDLVLQQFAQIIKQTKRNIDIAARYGGEEFAVILPETDLEGAIIFAERLRDATESNPVKIRDQSIVATVSIGVANFPTSAIRSRGQLIALADQALYEAKRNGRNGVRFAAEGTPIPETEPDQEIREAFI